jgi:large subunit ribosomal protein L6
MSRIGRKPIAIPANVNVTVDGNKVTVAGPKGTLDSTFASTMAIAVEGANVVVSRPDDEKESKALHGLTRTLISNMVTGVSEGFTKDLEVIGVGYRVAKQGTNLVMNLGYSHQVIIPETDGIKFECPDANKIKVIGIDKQRVGQVAAEIRGKRPPEPYKGKGIRYAGEFIIRKEGKTGKGK